MVLGRQSTLVCFFLVAASLSGCITVQPPIHSQDLDHLGRFEYRAPQGEMAGVVIGAPHGGTTPETATLARLISDHTGAGFVAGYGFKSKRVSVEQPIARSNPAQAISSEPSKRRSVFRELKEILRSMTAGELALYVGIRSLRADEGNDGLQAVTSGFTFEEIEVMERAYGEIRDRVIGATNVEKVPLSLAPLNRAGFDLSGIRHHGVLLVAERGLSLRIPEKLLAGANMSVYGPIFLQWIRKIEALARTEPSSLPRVEVTLTDLGRIDLFPSRNGSPGVIIGAPHGTYDAYTAEVVKQVSHRTGIAAVIARGFSPTEAGGWRINVNRPTEKTFLAPEFEVGSARSREVYHTFKDIILDAAGGDLRLYFDIHQYGADNTIQVATTRISREQARWIKLNYQHIRDNLLKLNPEVPRVSLLIEPLDNLEIAAWPAKFNGILSVAKKSLHIELPLHSALGSEKSRRLYTRVLSEVIKNAVHELVD